MPIYIRIPGWATKAIINGEKVQNGTMKKYICPSGSSEFFLYLNPDIRIEKWYIIINCVTFS